MTIEVELISRLMEPIFLFLIGWRPLVAVVIITAAKEEVRQSSMKTAKSA